MPGVGIAGRRKPDPERLVRLAPMRGRSTVLLSLALASLLAACVPEAVRPGGSGASAVATSTPVSTPAGPTPVPSFVRPTPTPVPSFRAYEVVGGDTLVSIARTFGTTARSIAYWNRGTYPNLDPESASYRPDL